MKLILILLPLLLLACETAPSKENKLMPIKPPKGYTPSIATPLTHDEVSTYAEFIPDSNSIIFLKKIGPVDQIFIKNLNDDTLRRVTYEKRSNYSPRYWGENKLIYYTSFISEGHQISLSNFEASESQSLAPWAPHPLLATPTIGDIFSISLNQSQLTQITNHKGFEGELSISPKSTIGIYSSFRGDYYQFAKLNLKNHKKQLLTNSKSNKRQISFSQNGRKVAYVDYKNNETFTSINIANRVLKSTTTLKLPKGVHISPQWYKDNNTILFSSNFEHADNFELYAFQIKQKCLHRLTYSPYFDINPTLKPNSDQILFVSNRTGAYKPYIINLKFHKTCLNIK